MVLEPGLGLDMVQEAEGLKTGSGSVEAGSEAHSQNQSPATLKMSPIHVVYHTTFSPPGPALLSFHVGRQSHGYFPNQ